MTRRSKIVVLIVVAMAAWFIYPHFVKWPIRNQKPTGTNIIAFGDSLTRGVGARDSESYPAVLGRMLRVNIINQGVAGNTTEDALKRLDRDVLALDPKIVLVCLGGNDLLEQKNDEEVFANLRQIVERIQAKGALVVLVGVEGFLVGPGSDYGKDFRNLAKETGSVLIPDIMDGILTRPSLMWDKIHPNAAGYRKFAEKIAPVLRQYL
ncbi:MAG: arylesterase [bacterium]